MQVGHCREALAGERPVAQMVRKPDLEKMVERVVLAPVRKNRAQPDDPAATALAVRRHQRLAGPFALGIGHRAVGRRPFVERAPRRMKTAGGDRAGEDDVASAEEPGRGEDVARPLDVGVLVLRMLFAGEVVVAGEVDDSIDRAPAPQPLAGGHDGSLVADVEVKPLPDRGQCRAAAARRRARNGEELMAVAEGFDQVPAQESGGSGHQNTGAFHGGSSSGVVHCNRTPVPAIRIEWSRRPRSGFRSFADETMPPEVRMILLERAYTSPIWYMPSS